jgi:hypothetical protein
LRTVETLEGEGGRKRVRIVERDDGAFVLVPEYWSEEHWEGKLIWSGWLPLSHNASFYQTAEIAEREARTGFHWLIPGPEKREI